MTIAYNPFNENLWANPWPTFKAMRDKEPVYFIEELNAWALSRFEDVWQASLDKTHFTAVHGTSPEALLLDKTLPPEVFLFMDPPAHRAHRGLVAAPYTPKNIAQLEKDIRKDVRKALAPALRAGELDIYQLASEVALRTIAGLIGLSYEQIRYIRRLIDRFYHRHPGHTGTSAEGVDAFIEARRYILELIEEFRLKPPPVNSHIHAWLHEEVDGKLMSEEAVFFSIFALVITGSDTLPLTTSAAVYYLSLQPDSLSAVRQDPQLLSQAFAEAARVDQPTNILGRVVAEDFELRGKQLKKGQAVLFLYASANRDEREFDNPDEFQLHRKARRNLSFGAGLHFCLGQHLARLEGKIILEELFSSIEDFSVDYQNCERIFGEFLQGYCKMPIHFQAS